MTTETQKITTARRLFVVSTVLFVIFVVLSPGGTLGIAASGALLVVMDLVSNLAGIFAWVLMCVAYNMHKKLSSEASAAASDTAGLKSS